MSGISAQYVDGLEFRIKELGEQVSKLTKERDDLRSRRCEVCGYLEHEREHTGCLREQLAALAEQNEKIRAALDIAHAHADSLADSPEEMRIVNAARLLPNLSTPVLNKYRAEGMQMAAEICEHISDEYREREGRRYPELKTDAESGASDCESSIRARADELEKTNG